MSLPSPIAIDGPSASGKSTVARELARRFGYIVIDTGMTYRAFAAVALDRGVAAEDTAACASLAATIDLSLEDEQVFVDGVDLTERLREPAVEAAVSAYSAIPTVRDAMVRVQREAGDVPLCVAVGRDMGTEVFPDAPLKFFLNATQEARASRRSKQAGTWGQEQDATEAGRDIKRRDRIDTTRAASPLRPARDAIVIDTTDLTEQELLDQVIARVSAWVA